MSYHLDPIVCSVFIGQKLLPDWYLVLIYLSKTLYVQKNFLNTLKTKPKHLLSERYIYQVKWALPCPCPCICCLYIHSTRTCVNLHPVMLFPVAFFFLLPQPELGIYNRKQESKKKKENTLSTKKATKSVFSFSFFLDRYRCFFFLGRKRVFFFFFALLFSFIKSHLRILRICNLSTVEPLYNEVRDEIPRTMRKVSYQSISFS